MSDTTPTTPTTLRTFRHPDGGVTATLRYTPAFSGAEKYQVTIWSGVNLAKAQPWLVRFDTIEKANKFFDEVTE